MSKPFESKTYYALALDPIHVGTGGYRLGRVDLSIVREPGTNLPKVPGTSLSGVARAYTAMAVEPQRYRWGTNGERSCAGKGGPQGDDHCGASNCPVCVTYGFSRGGGKSSFQGLAQFFDARILFFPVHSMRGPVWVTCASVLDDFAQALKQSDSNLSLTTNAKLSEDDNELQTELVPPKDPLNLGWLLLVNKSSEPPLKAEGAGLGNDFQAILKRLVLVSNKLFSHIVNDNLEVRTSVAIDPDTRAAESGALYSYEAIPRGTVLWFQVVFNKPKHFRIQGEGITKEDAKADATSDDIKEYAEDGLRLMQYLGVGGMGTRGMGRLKVLNLDDARPAAKAVAQTGKAVAGGGK